MGTTHASTSERSPRSDFNGNSSGDRSSSYGGEPEDSVVLLSVMVGLYAALGVIVLWRLYVHATTSRCFNRVVQSHLLLLCFCIDILLLGVVSFLILEVDSLADNSVMNATEYFFSTTSHSLFYAALLLVIMHMVDTMYSFLAFKKPNISQAVTIAFWILMAIPILYIFATAIYFACIPEEKAHGNPIYDVAIISVSVYAALCALAYLITGILVLHRVKYLERRDAFFRVKRRPLYLMFLILFLCFACFLLEGGMFLYKPITGKEMPDYLFDIFAYWVPEIGSALLVMLIVRKPMEHRDYKSLNDNDK
ncbi:hypothetical protein Pelo_15150 [Pelomyxa schiedti]|nr:hypothetical protein Pelo_15150 [Pelomyxa schiedti]